jgi:hypothetical protein
MTSPRFTTSDNPAASIISSRPFNGDFTSSGSIETTKRWLAECDANHEECRAPMPGFSPTRLIDLSQSSPGNRIQIISHCDSTQSTFRYATLSYCWGGDQLVTTTKATIAQHEIGIEPTSLGQTLQDAIRLALALGINFLWIDSLCIIQDDYNDSEVAFVEISSSCAELFRKEYRRVPIRETLLVLIYHCSRF